MTLKEIRYIDKEIQRLKTKLVRLESEVYGVSPKVNFTPPSSGTSDKIGNTVALIADIQTDIQALKTNRFIALNRLSKNKFEENCLYMRLSLHYSWAKIAAITGTSVDSIKKMCYRYHW